MATTTPNLGLTKPDPNGDDDAWAPMLNGNADILDTQVKAAQTAAAAAGSNANGRVSKAGDTMTGALTVAPVSGTQAIVGATATGTATADVILASAAGNRAGIRLRTGGADRWKIVKSTSAESGSNVGSDFGIVRCNDAGSEIEFAFNITRSTGDVTIARGLTVNSVSTFNNFAAFNSHISVRGYDTVGGADYGKAIFLNGSYGALDSGSYIQQVHIPAVSAYIHMIFSGYEWKWDNGGNFYSPNNGYKPGGGSWADSSDARVKERIEAYPTGLNAILQLSPRIYSFKAETGRDPERRYIGAIAQDVETVMPEMVTTGRLVLGDIDLPDGRTMEQTSLPWALVNAVQELHAIVEAQAARIAALEAAQP